MAGCLSLAQLPIAQALALADQLTVFNQGEPVLFSDSLGAFTGQDPRGTIALLEDQPGQPYGIQDPFHTDHRAVIETPAAHDPAIELYLSLEIQNASPAGIEAPV